MMNLKLISLNIRGINKPIKRRNLFRWLHNGKYDVIFLQETYSDKTIENVWRAEWRGDIFYSHVLKMLKPPNVERKLLDQNISPKAVYELPFKVTMENKDVFNIRWYITFYLLTAIFTI